MEEVPILFVSRTCKIPEVHLDYPSNELAMAIFAMGKFKNYLGFAHFTLLTDSTSGRVL